jgi:hypothetical protein
MAGLQQRRGGAWHDITAGHPVLARAGHTSTLRLVYAGGSKGKTFHLAVPAGTSGSGARLDLFSAQGFPFEPYPMPKSLGGVQKLVDGAVRNDQADVVLEASGASGRPVQVHLTTPPDDEVITGHQAFKVKVL